MTKLVGWVALFACLTIAGSIWAISRAPIDAAQLWAVISSLPVATLALLAALCVGIYAADALRYRALGAAIDAKVTWRAAIDTSVANFFFSWITPGSTFGAPATGMADATSRAALLAQIPLGRWGDPAEIEGAILFLASDASS